LIFESLVVRDVEGERSFPRKALPLRVGTGNECQLRLPGPGGDAIAMLDLLDGIPIVQPVGQGTSLLINDAPLETSRRLADGDVLAFFGSEIRVSLGEQGVAIDVRLEDSAYVTQPPESAAAFDRPDDEKHRTYRISARSSKQCATADS